MSVRRCDLRDRHAFIRLVHRAAGQGRAPRPGNGADEPRIRRAAGGGEFRRARRSHVSPRGHEIGEAARFGEEHFAADADVSGDLAARVFRDRVRFAFDQRCSDVGGMRRR